MRTIPMLGELPAWKAFEDLTDSMRQHGIYAGKDLEASLTNHFGENVPEYLLAKLDTLKALQSV